MFLVSLLSVVSIMLECVWAGYDVSVSGVSSGGFMAVQHHVAFSSQVKTVGVVAGGPYLCENIPACTKYPELIDEHLLEAVTANLALSGVIDNPANMRGSKAYLYSGSLDTVVNPGVVKKLSNYYRVFGVHVEEMYDVASEHGWPSESYGVPCWELKSPYINKCGFSFSKYMFGESSDNRDGKIVQVGQVGGELVSMAGSAYVYIPNNISKNEIHVSYHGCEQTIDDIGTSFVLHSGLNDVGVIVIYPQAVRTIVNPYGCWDWWGYTGPNFATKLSPQMNVVMDLVRRVADIYMKSIIFS